MYYRFYKSSKHVKVQVLSTCINIVDCPLFNFVLSILFRGKGDYHRLGHGTDDHVRRPRRVTALQGKKVISIACGSLHCVAGTDTGRYFIL